MAYLWSLLIWAILSVHVEAAGMKSYVFTGNLLGNDGSIMDPSIRSGSEFRLIVDLPEDTPASSGDISRGIYSHYSIPLDFPGAGMRLEIEGRPIAVGGPMMGYVAVHNPNEFGATFEGRQLFDLDRDPSVAYIGIHFDLRSDAFHFSDTILPNELNIGDFREPRAFYVSVYRMVGQNLVRGGAIVGEINSIQVVPEPGTAAILGVGALACLGWNRRRRQYRP